MTPFEDTVRSIAEELHAWPADFPVPHVHFDDKRFDGLVPDFAHATWIDLAITAADAAAPAGGPFLIHVPLGEWKLPPEGHDLHRLTELRPWEPPAIYLLNRGSAFASRDRDGAWHDDAATPAKRATGWFGGHLVEDSRLWRIALMYETEPSNVE